MSVCNSHSMFVTNTDNICQHLPTTSNNAKSISFQDTNVVTTHMVTTGNTQRFSSIGGVARAYCAHSTYCDWVYTMKGATIRRFNQKLTTSELPGHTILPIKSPKPEYLCGNFHIFSTLAPTFLNLYRPNNTCLKSLQQSVF